MKNKKRSNGRHGHFSGTNSRRPANVVGRNTVLESNGPIGHIRGTASQLAEKYMAALKDARHQGDHILAELCSQQAEHFVRVANQAIQYEMAAKQEAAQNEPVVEQAEPSEPVADEETPVANVEEEKPASPAKDEGKTKPKRRHLFIKKKETVEPAEEPTKEE